MNLFLCMAVFSPIIAVVSSRPRDSFPKHKDQHPQGLRMARYERMGEPISKWKYSLRKLQGWLRGMTKYSDNFRYLTRELLHALQANNEQLKADSVPVTGGGREIIDSGINTLKKLYRDLVDKLVSAEANVMSLLNRSAADALVASVDAAHAAVSDARAGATAGALTASAADVVAKDLAVD